MEHLFSPNSSKYLRSDARQSQIIGGDTVKFVGGIYPPFPPGFGTPVVVDGISKNFSKSPYLDFFKLATNTKT